MTLSADLARLVQQLRNDSNDEAADLILDLTERAEAAESEIELLRTDLAAHMATALAENERAEAAEHALKVVEETKK